MLLIIGFFSDPNDPGFTNSYDIAKIDSPLSDKQCTLCILANLVQGVLASASLCPLIPYGGVVCSKFRMASGQRVSTLPSKDPVSIHWRHLEFQGPSYRLLAVLCVSRTQFLFPSGSLFVLLISHQWNLATNIVLLS